MLGGAGWPNTGGQDIAFVKAMLDWLRSKYCIDEQRIFSTGMSYGGIMSNTIGCQLGGVFRAIAPMSGSGPLSFGGNQCMGQVAVWQSHGDMDDVVSTASGEMSRDHWVMNNHCTMETKPVDPDPCVAYQGCDDGFPVTWCEFPGGHTIRRSRARRSGSSSHSSSRRCSTSAFVHSRAYHGASIITTCGPARRSSHILSSHARGRTRKLYQWRWTSSGTITPMRRPG